KRKRDERRKKREDEMWQKEKLNQEREEKRTMELRRKKEVPARRKPAPPVKPEIRHRPPETPMGIPAPPPGEAKKVPKKKEVFKPKTEEVFTPEELAAKESAHKKMKKRTEEEKPKLMKVPKRMDKKPVDEGMSEDDIKSEIQLEELKAKMREQQQGKKEPEKKKKIAYKDKASGFGGNFASKLDEIVKKEDQDKDKKGK
ncbi:MAG: hypothetical protein GY950_14990, partial [bacterium]|nr:hypothetical protein [bacterium]